MKLAAAAAVALAGICALGAGGSTTEAISMTARPLVLRWNDRVMLSGSVASGRDGVTVTVESQPCGEGPWREVGEVSTGAGGSWTTEVSPGITSVLRATAGGATSNTVRVQQRASVSLGQRPPGTFFIFVNAQRPMWHKRVTLQRFDTAKRSWIAIRSVLLTDTGAPQGVGWIYSGTEKFKVKVPKRTLLRATLPLAQARPCYLAGYSNLLRR
jgi:hypothetical protein